jgi:hypothetical protein
MPDVLKARKTHLTALLKIVNTTFGKTTETQKLTAIAIKAEINYIDRKLKNKPDIS